VTAGNLRSSLSLSGPRVSGSLWSVARERAIDEAMRLIEAGLGALHWDLTDGIFAQPGGFSPKVAAEISALTAVSAEAHLMVREPLQHLDAWTDFCDIVTVHAEAHDWQSAVERIAHRGSTPAVALSPGTSPRVLGSDQLGTLVMSVWPGQGGATFDEQALATLVKLRGRRLLGVDGGVTAARAADAAQHGATWIISGSDLLASKDPAAWIAGVGAARAAAP